MCRKSWRKSLVAAIERLEIRNLCIVGGKVVEGGSLRFAVAITSPFGAQYCGGSLISDTHVLTAAHCNVSRGDQVVINRTDLRSDAGEVISVAGVNRHPRYNGQNTDAAPNNDIAIVTLSRAASQGTSIRPVKHDTLTKPGESATVVGWGLTKENGNSSDVLRAVRVPFFSNADANRPGSYNGQVNRNMLAAGSTGKDSCQGDSGGPLFMPNDAGDLRQVGIVSWGNGCARRNFPGVYTRVANYYDWINDVVRQRSFDDGASPRAMATNPLLRSEITDDEESIAINASQYLSVAEPSSVESLFANWDEPIDSDSGLATVDAVSTGDEVDSQWDTCVQAVLEDQPLNDREAVADRLKSAKTHIRSFASVSDLAIASELAFAVGDQSKAGNNG